MVLAPIDRKIIYSKELSKLLEQYLEKFGEQFILFNYADFPGEEGKIASQMYKETLIKALESDEPYHIVSHRFDTIDH